MWVLHLFLCFLPYTVLCVQAVVQEQGLMNEYKRLRRSAIQTTDALKQKHHLQSECSNPESKHTLTLTYAVGFSCFFAHVMHLFV